MAGRDTQQVRRPGDKRRFVPSRRCCSQALLKSSASAGFCSGVILKENLVLTSAQCASKYSSFQVAVGE